MSDSHKWLVHGERLVDDTPYVRISLADVEIPGHSRFTQYVFRMRRVAVTVVLDDAGEQVLLMRRHRFIVDRWVWELPGGYVDDGEDPAVAAAREVEEGTGWRPRQVEFALSAQPLIGNADYPQDLFLGTGAELTGEPEADEAAEVRWVPLTEAHVVVSIASVMSAGLSARLSALARTRSKVAEALSTSGTSVVTTSSTSASASRTSGFPVPAARVIAPPSPALAPTLLGTPALTASTGGQPPLAR